MTSLHKYFSLLALTLHSSVHSLSMRYAKTRPGEPFLNSTAVLIAEVARLIICLIVIFYEEGKEAGKFLSTLYKYIIANPFRDTLNVGVPSLVYNIQNNLIYVAVSHLDAATFQVTFQMKIITTALFAGVILQRKLFLSQWGALVLLVIGVALVQLEQFSKDTSTASANKNTPGQDQMFGLIVALSASVLSGFAGTYFEKIIKSGDIPFWICQMQLHLMGVLFAIITCFLQDASKIYENGFFVGYDLFICYVVLLNAVGGFIVAYVVIFNDSILKGFATSIAIIITSIASKYLFDFNLTLRFAAGVGLVIVSTLLYSHKLLAN